VGAVVSLFEGGQAKVKIAMVWVVAITVNVGCASEYVQVLLASPGLVAGHDVMMCLSALTPILLAVSDDKK
jgi:hypothetical protein